VRTLIYSVTYTRRLFGMAYHGVISPRFPVGKPACCVFGTAVNRSAQTTACRKCRHHV